MCTCRKGLLKDRCSRDQLMIICCMHPCAHILFPTPAATQETCILLLGLGLFHAMHTILHDVPLHLCGLGPSHCIRLP